MASPVAMRFEDVRRIPYLPLPPNNDFQTASEWNGLVLTSQAIKDLPLPSYLEPDSEAAVAVRYTCFDDFHRVFFGRTWQSSWISVPWHEQHVDIRLDARAACLTRLLDPDCHVVVELVLRYQAPTRQANQRTTRFLGLGWTILPAFSQLSEAPSMTDVRPDAAPTHNQPLLPGTPRALLVLKDGPLASHWDELTQSAGNVGQRGHLHLHLAQWPPLLHCKPYIQDNWFFGPYDAPAGVLTNPTSGLPWPTTCEPAEPCSREAAEITVTLFPSTSEYSNTLMAALALMGVHNGSIFVTPPSTVRLKSLEDTRLVFDGFLALRNLHELPHLAIMAWLYAEYVVDDAPPPQASKSKTRLGSFRRKGRAVSRHLQHSVVDNSQAATSAAPGTPKTHAPPHPEQSTVQPFSEEQALANSLKSIVDEAEQVEFRKPFATPQRPVSAASQSTGRRPGDSINRSSRGRAPLESVLETSAEHHLEDGRPVPRLTLDEERDPSPIPILHEHDHEENEALASPPFASRARGSALQTKPRLRHPDENVPALEGRDLALSASVAELRPVLPTGQPVARPRFEAAADDLPFPNLPRRVLADLQATPLLNLVDAATLEDMRRQFADGPLPISKGTLQEGLESQDPLSMEDLRLHLVAYQHQAPRLPPSGLPGAPARAWEGPRQIYVTFAWPGAPLLQSPALLIDDNLSTHADDSHSAFGRCGVLRTGHAVPTEVGWACRHLLRPSLLDLDRVQLARFLASETLDILVFDADSHALVGQGYLPLRFFLRQGRRCTVTPIELQLLAVGLPPPLGPTDRGGPAALLPRKLQGTLFLRIASIGRAPTPGRDATILQRDHGFAAAAARASTHEGSRLPLAPRLVDNHPNMPAALALLSSDQEAQRKRLQLANVLQRHRLPGAPAPAAGEHLAPTSAAGLANNLAALEAVRQEHKHEAIERLLRDSIRCEVELTAVYGCLAYVEFEVSNPTAQPLNVELRSSDEQLFPLVDSRQWQACLRAYGSRTPLERDLLQVNNGRVLLFLHPHERVTIPVGFRLHHLHPAGRAQPLATTPAVFGPDAYRDPMAMGMLSTDQQQTAIEWEPIRAELSACRLDSGDPVAVCAVLAHPARPTAVHIESFVHEENSMFRKQFSWPLPATLAGERVEPCCVVSADEEASVHVQPSPIGDHVAVFYRRAVGPNACTINSYVFLYADDACVRPIATRLIQLRAVETFHADITCGELSQATLILRASRPCALASCHSSQPADVSVEPASPFALVANAVTELKVALHPVVITATERQERVLLALRDHHQGTLLHMFLLQLRIRAPVVSKAFAVSFLDDRPLQRRITYDNTTSHAKDFHLYTDRPDLLQFKNKVRDICL
ncbi:uncharacterized protein MONBRDRAFT_8015 [Monosiga brevicollis MX1]|uniref:Nephrocystin-4 n=1 Tax=Monosiga brevicollis TaxID=81824 RepID=A9UYS8_MONBE|nr:uncharacterized protein MONBRDRAFT_8015 [Monosiga brevicollis MX1]EDQ89515.1 predicted protein [Monosiga brevicollis MX1]|eukprot:XP_001745544.1 hypothetical protein [Monosiga brevicollis MX1]